MAASRAVVLFAGDSVWRIASPGGADELRFEPGAGAGEIAASVAERLRQRGYDGAAVLLALPSAWCLAATIDTDDLPAGDHAALAFRLEEKLPIPAEHFTADFVRRGATALGACVSNERVRPLVDALEGAGVPVLAISPAVMVAVQFLAPGAGERLVIWARDGWADVVSMSDGVPTSWALVEGNAAAIRLQVDLTAARGGGGGAMPPIVLCGEAEDVAGGLVGLDVTRRSETIEDAVAGVAEGLRTARVTPWFQFRRGAIAAEDTLRGVRRALNAALASAALLTIVAAGVFLYRSVAYDRLARQREQQLTEAFRQQFPGWTVPPNVRATVESERRRLTGGGGSAVPAVARASALRVLHDVLANVPATTRIQLERMTFNDTSVEVGGTSRAHEDVEALAAAARSAGLDVPPPEMQKLPAAWRFTVRGNRPAQAADNGATP